ncbi:hypothetical protein [Paractinoplanes atraurantiacus]|uniref:Uncharacterized protein n=1 Tax=Paractinoplanes atraurantiacus TaxID=1036182 RepID=A0A285FEQ3_9ACTN|nr:hypothetical protein [Actinoplanes atraurantiacus]SNY09780.1 hypothetical protein SAMN05421748_101900 [Actinoplanes atraurantiacus]
MTTPINTNTARTTQGIPAARGYSYLLSVRPIEVGNFVEFRQTEITRDWPITSANSITELQQLIAEHFDAPDQILTGFSLLGIQVIRPGDPAGKRPNGETVTRRYRYFVSTEPRRARSSTPLQRIEITQETPINSLNDVMKVEELLRHHHRMPNPVVLSFHDLGTGVVR